MNVPGPAVVRWLREQKHEVFSVYEEARGIDDNNIIRKAFEEHRILITNKKTSGKKYSENNTLIVDKINDCNYQ